MADLLSRRKLTVSVAGDGGIPGEPEKVRLAEELGRALVDAGYRVVTGGLGGIMEAAHRGAKLSECFEPGDTIAIVPESEPMTANPYADVVIPTSLGHGRNFLIAQSDALVAIGGGAGTLTEMAFAWIKDRFVIGYRVEGWSGRLAGSPLDQRRRPVAFEDDRVYGVSSAVEVIELLRRYLPR